MTVYFNDNEPYVAEWLKNLYPKADVDSRSVTDIQPQQLTGYMRAHFFAGIGGWELALNMAGWPDNLPVWTASLPCQPFSTAGLRRGESDERHLWPIYRELVIQQRPFFLLGEQVAGKAGIEWLDNISADLEREDYAVGAAILGAHSVGAPHIRQRIYWAAYSVRDFKSWQESRGRKTRRVGREHQPVSWDEPWQSALSKFRALDDGVSRRVGATDAARNAIVPPLAAEFVGAFMDVAGL
ncbi:MAG: DNA cytosine methyltransferase [Desulfurellales bacterium]|nr:MAG: DNA cytosine methyltransferase [Desulfurellales bacterium]